MVIDISFGRTFWTSFRIEQLIYTFPTYPGIEGLILIFGALSRALPKE